MSSEQQENITESNNIPTTVGKKRGRPPKTKVLQEGSEEKDVSEKRKVGRPKKAKVTESENQQGSTALEALRETKDIESRKKKKTQRHRDFPKKTKWDEIVGNCFRDIIPAHRLPLNRVVMQRYDNMRRTQGNRTTIHEYAKQLFDEISGPDGVV